jgi:ketosteroid isomerase-like protein
LSEQYQGLIKQAYEAFNARDIDSVLSLMRPDVHWPNGWEGGYVSGHEEVRDYWTRQWKEIDPFVKPVSFRETDDGRLDVEVHQLATDKTGNVLFEGTIHHIYDIEDGLIRSMEIVKNDR